MYLFDVREPINAWSHGAAMMLALPVTWVLWKRCREWGACGPTGLWECASHARYHRVKALCLLILGISLVVCYGMSAAFHAAPLGDELLGRLRRLDHIGIYLLITGTYTPVAWALMHGSWLWGTLTTAWAIAAVCAARVWWGDVQPIWISTLQYMIMGWGGVLGYHQLTRTHSHRTLLPLPLGGVFYSLGAVLNLAK